MVYLKDINRFAWVSGLSSCRYPEGFAIAFDSGCKVSELYSSSENSIAAVRCAAKACGRGMSGRGRS